MASAMACAATMTPQASLPVRQTLNGTSLKKSPFVSGRGKCLPSASSRKGSKVVFCEAGASGDKWAALGRDISDDQQDITRGKGLVDSAFQGGFGMGTQNAIMSSYDYISQGQRNYEWDNMKDGLYIAPAFMDKVVVHLSKNFMNLPNIKVPLILGVWGGKGQGKSFQSELIFAKLGINPIVMSAGELESGNAGEPAKLIRQRYREAADIIKKGKMCCMFINDLDAGAGRMGGTTQYTVNNQMVNATLMNIADNPTNVQLPGVYNKEEIPRVPIIVTGNDFSTLYAPLIRDGRMEKFYWAPTREDRIGVAKGIFRLDGISDDAVTTLVDTFPGQSIDFFGALRARVYDDEVRKWVEEVGLENMGKKLVNSREGPPTFKQPQMTLDLLLQYGWMLVQEQENVKRVQLADEYLSGAALGDANADVDRFQGKAAQQLPPPVKQGCADPNATNFDPTARSDDGSCVYDFSEPPKPIIPSSPPPVRGGVRGRGRGRSVSPSRGASPPPSSYGSYTPQESFSASLDSLIQKTPSLDSVQPIIPQSSPSRGVVRGRGRGSARSRSPARGSSSPAPSYQSDSFQTSSFNSSFTDSLENIKPIVPSSPPSRGGPRGSSRGGPRSRSPTRPTPSYVPPTSNGSFFPPPSVEEAIIPIIPASPPVRGSSRSRGRGLSRSRSTSPSRSYSSPPSSSSYSSYSAPAYEATITPIIPASPPVRGARGRGRGLSRSRSPPRSSSQPSNGGLSSFSAPAFEEDIVPIIPMSTPVRGARGRGRGLSRSRSPTRSYSPPPSNGTYSTPSPTFEDTIVPIIPSSIPVRGGRGRGRGLSRSRSPARSRSYSPPPSNGTYSVSSPDIDNIIPIIPASPPVRGARGRGRGLSRSRSPTRYSSSPSNGGYSSFTSPAAEDDIIPIIPASPPVRGVRGRGRGHSRSRSPPRSASPPPSYYPASDSFSASSEDEIIPIIPASRPVRGARGRSRGLSRSRSPSRATSPPPSNSFFPASDSFYPASDSFSSVEDTIVPIIPASTPVRGARGRGRGLSRSRSPTRAVPSYTAQAPPAASYSSSFEDIKPIIPASPPPARGGLRGRSRGGARSRSPSSFTPPPPQVNESYSNTDSYFPAEPATRQSFTATTFDIQPVVPSPSARGRAGSRGRGRGRPRSRSPSREPVRDVLENENASFWNEPAETSYSSYNPSPIVPIIPKDSGRGRARSKSRGRR